MPVLASHLVRGSAQNIKACTHSTPAISRASLASSRIANRKAPSHEARVHPPSSLPLPRHNPSKPSLLQMPQATLKPEPVCCCNMHSIFTRSRGAQQVRVVTADRAPAIRCFAVLTT